MLYNLLESPDYNVLGCFCKYSYKCIFLVFTVFIIILAEPIYGSFRAPFSLFI